MPLETRVVSQQVADPHAFVEPPFFGEIAESVVGDLAGFATEHDDVPAVGLEDSQNHP